MTALFAALACVATMSIRIPTPGTGGYIHPGDAIVILAGIILGPVYDMFKPMGTKTLIGWMIVAFLFLAFVIGCSCGKSNTEKVDK